MGSILSFDFGGECLPAVLRGVRSEVVLAEDEFIDEIDEAVRQEDLCEEDDDDRETIEDYRSESELSRVSRLLEDDAASQRVLDQMKRLTVQDLEDEFGEDDDGEGPYRLDEEKEVEYVGHDYR